MILLQNISKDYKTDFWKPPSKVIDNMNFKIKSGSITGFLGANGAGKTTTIKIILGITCATKGSVDFSKLGVDRKSFLKNVGHLPERPYFYKNSTGRELLKFLGGLSEIKQSEIGHEIVSWAKRLDMIHALDRKMSAYSKGMLQRIGVIASLMHRPKLLILDEPVSGLDPIGRKEIKEILKELNQTMGTTIFFSTHIIPDVEELCDRIVFIQKGKLVYSGELSELMPAENKKFYIQYQINDSINEISINADQKDLKLNELIHKGAVIQKLCIQTPKLEDILYHYEK